MTLSLCLSLALPRWIEQRGHIVANPLPPASSSGGLKLPLEVAAPGYQLVASNQAQGHRTDEAIPRRYPPLIPPAAQADPHLILLIFASSTTRDACSCGDTTPHGILDPEAQSHTLVDLGLVLLFWVVSRMVGRANGTLYSSPQNVNVSMPYCLVALLALMHLLMAITHPILPTKTQSIRRAIVPYSPALPSCQPLFISLVRLCAALSPPNLHLGMCCKM